jgi:hypothetical protein
MLKVLWIESLLADTPHILYDWNKIFTRVTFPWNTKKIIFLHFGEQPLTYNKTGGELSSYKI